MYSHHNFVGSMTLKALLEDPNLKNPPPLGQSSSDLKIKKENGSSELPQLNYGSAFLGPNLWDRTYDGLDFNLEYMDLDEFLSENAIVGAEDLTKSPPHKMSDDTTPVPVVGQMPVSPREFLNTSPLSPSQFGGNPIPAAASAPAPSPKQSPTYSSTDQVAKQSSSPPVSPLHVEFHMSEQDVALSSIPGLEGFDPRKRNFTDEELKPQPVIKKSKKVFVPDEMKDERYWARRNKNNFAAKRSRDARRVKENQIAMRASFLERENQALREEVSRLRKENVNLKSKVSKYEPSQSPTADPVSSSNNNILGIP